MARDGVTRRPGQTIVWGYCPRCRVGEGQGCLTARRTPAPKVHVGRETVSIIWT